ncbi:MAG: hypothetical protein PHT38_07710 [Halothiobacillus sp.]|nr:hypothetical protein [Halothiobacillus sp.]
MLSNYIRPMGRVMAFAAVMGLTACGGGGGTSLTQSKPPSITLSATSYSLPVQNTGYVYPDQSSLYNARIMATAVDNKGNTVPSGQITFTVSGGQTNVGALYESDFKTKVTDSNGVEHPAAFWGLPVDISGGMAQCVFQAHNQTGTANIVATYTDANGQSTQQTIQINVGSPVNTGLPSSFQPQVSNLPVFVTGQGKNSQAIIETYIVDPANQRIVSNGANNVQAQIIGSNLGGAYLIGANGQSGQSVSSQTTGSSGIAQFTLQTGSESGFLKIRLTADGADNNVDNGIQQPVSNDISVAVSDGRVASLSFTSPYINAIRNNKSSVALDTTAGDTFDQGTYSRAISVEAQDANGAPVAGTQIRLGLIDSPLTNYPATSGTFAIQGVRGNPTESGNTFSENDGINLITAGVNSLDRLVLVPSEQGTDRELRLSRLISALQAGTTNSVITTTNFPAPTVAGYNANADIPWVIGRPQYGNITATATTDASGVATVFMTYPVSRLGQPAILTAEADNGVSAVFGARYAGIAGGTLTSSITNVPSGAAQTSTSVTMCAKDGSEVPLTNYPITAGLINGVTTDPSSIVTGPSGCATFTLKVPPTISVDNTTTPPTVTTLITTPFTLTFTSGTGPNEKVEITVDSPPTP